MVVSKYAKGRVLKCKPKCSFPEFILLCELVMAGFTAVDAPLQNAPKTESNQKPWDMRHSSAEVEVNRELHLE